MTWLLTYDGCVFRLQQLNAHIDGLNRSAQIMRNVICKEEQEKKGGG